MNKTNLSSITKQHVHTPVSLRKPLRCGFTILLCSCVFFGASRCRAQETQDAAEAARQERVRKEQSTTQKHVYTEDDLGRLKILTPEDEARFAAQRRLQPPANETQPSLDANGFYAGADVPHLPLGDIARRYRDAKLALQAPTPFHLPFDEPAFAAPIVAASKPAPPRPDFLPAHPNLAPAHRSAAAAPSITNPAPLHRVDPFARRSAPLAPPAVAHVAPTARVAQPRVSHPASAPELRQPNLSRKIAAPSLESRKFSPLAAQPTVLPVPVLPASPATQPDIATSVTPRPALAQPSSPLHTITVQRGDSLWKLAQRTLGRGSRWLELLAANPSIVNPTRLEAGTKIVIPQQNQSLASSESHSTITIQKGDSLTKIAQSHFRRATAWRCIAQANPEISDPNRIYEGQQLLLPFSCKE